MNVVESASLPASSVALQVTVVVPIWKLVPEAGKQVAVPGPSTASVVPGEVYVTLAPFALVASAVTGPCEAITGAVVSATVTVNVVESASLAASSVGCR